MKNKVKRKNSQFKLRNIRWVVLITILTFILSVFMSFFSDLILRNSNVAISFLVLISIVFTGILFDIIGIAVTAVDQKPFNSMASAKVKGALNSIQLIQNASKVSSLCNDVIGDICGIISGASVTFIVFEAAQIYNVKSTAFVTVLISSFVASLTVGGKAIGKDISINNSKGIIIICGKVLYEIEKITHLHKLKR